MRYEILNLATKYCNINERTCHKMALWNWLLCCVVSNQNLHHQFVKQSLGLDTKLPHPTMRYHFIYLRPLPYAL